MSMPGTPNGDDQTSAPAGAPRVVRSVVCTRCGCTCDDIDLTVSAGRVTEARNACEPGRSWFLRPRAEDDPPALLDRQPADAETAIAAAAALLAGASRPLIWGLLHTSCEAQRVAVAIAERLGGVIDPAAGPNHLAAVTAFEEWGEVSTMLGEVANQDALIVLWLAEPERTHPRLLERWRVAGADERRVIRFRPGDPAAGSWSVPEGRELEFLWVLRELAHARAPGGAAVSRTTDGSGEGAGAALRRGGTPDAGALYQLAARLLDRLGAASYVVLAFDAPAAGPALQHALRATAATLNAITRVRLVPLRGAGNRVGAEAVLTWQTGFPGAVDFAAGAPRANGGEYSAARLLERGEVDAALVVCADPADIPGEPALGELAELPLVVVDSEPGPLAERARVALRSAPVGLASGGTFFRMDAVALTLRPALESRYPSEADWLSRILARLPPRATGDRVSARSGGEPGGGRR